MALYLLIRDHKAHAGAVEVGWRLEAKGGYHREGDVIFAYHSSVEQMLRWAQQPARRWQEKVPLGIVDVRDSWIPEHKLFASVPVLSKVTYYMLDPSFLDSGHSLPMPESEPGDPEQGMWMARDKMITPGAISRRTVYNAAFGAPAGAGSVRDRLQARFMEELNQMDYWAARAEAKGELDG